MATTKVSQLRERCERLLKHLQIEKLLSPEELKEEQADHPRSRDDWWERYARLKSYARRLEWKKDARGSTGKAAAPTGPEAEEMKIRMLLAHPVEVMLDDGKRYKVHPKSYNALCMVVSIDYAIAWLVEIADEMARNAKPEAPAFLPRIAEQIGRLQNIMCDIILHSGPGFDPKKLDDPTPYDFSPMDLITLQNAHNDVNVVRMMAFPLVTRRKTEKKPDSPTSTGWSDFFVIMGFRRKTDPMSLMNDEALSKLFAEAHIGASHQQAHEDKLSA